MLSILMIRLFAIFNQIFLSNAKSHDFKILNCRHPVRMFIKTTSGIHAASMLGSFKNQYFSYSFQEDSHYPASEYDDYYNKMSASYYCSSENENARNVRFCCFVFKLLSFKIYFQYKLKLYDLTS